MKITIIKNLQKRNGLFDRALIIDIIENKKVFSYFFCRYYRNFLKLFEIKFLEKREVSALEIIGSHSKQINFFSRLENKLKKLLN